MATEVIGTSALKVESCFNQNQVHAARQLGPDQRKQIAVQALARSEPIAHLAGKYDVSRNFVYRHASKASSALDEAFAPSDKDDKVLFNLPVTKDWLRQFVLASVLVGHNSMRGVLEILDAVFDYRGLSVGTVHNIVHQAVAKACVVNQAQALSGIDVGAHDEIFQAGKPVLVGMDVQSTYCYLLSLEEHRDETTWGVHLLDLADKGLCPDYTIADGGKGLRAGQKAAWPSVACHGDVFHPERDLGKLASFLEHRAASCTTAREKLERQMLRCKKRGKGQTLSKRLALARQAELRATHLAQDIGTLADWMQNDILSLAGPDRATRADLFDFVVEQLEHREHLCIHRIRPVRTMLQNQRDDLLAFAGILDERFAGVAAHMKVPLHLVHSIGELQGMDQRSPAHWQRKAQLQHKLKHRFHDTESAVRQVLADTPRASSIVENLNSRLRNYFFLRRQIGNGYLDLLRFFLNHRCFLRSDRPERVGKSPAELLTGQAHPHWLEMLGFERFDHAN